MFKKMKGHFNITHTKNDVIYIEKK